MGLPADIHAIRLAMEEQKAFLSRLTTLAEDLHRDADVIAAILKEQFPPEPPIVGLVVVHGPPAATEPASPQ